MDGEAKDEDPRLKVPPDPGDGSNKSQEMEQDLPNNGEKSKPEPFIYETSDEGPYVIFVETSSGEGNGIDRIHPMALGNMFKRIHPEIQNKIERVYKNGKNRLKLVMKDRTSANILANSEKMKQKGLSCYIPKFLVTKQGIIRGVLKDLSEEEIKSECQLPYELRDKARILSVKRFNRKVNDEWLPTETVQLTFRAQILPSYVTIHYYRCKVDTFIPKVHQCSKCLRYGHIVKFCKSTTARCDSCGNDDHETKDCTVSPPPKCIHCKGEHRSYIERNDTNKCPEYKKQLEIKKIMVRENKTFLEARLAIQKKSYSSVAGNKNSNLQDTFSVPSTPAPQPSSSQVSIYRKRRRNSPPLPNLSMQKQRELYNSCNNDTYLPSSPIIGDSTAHSKPGVNNSYVSQPTSPSLSSQNFTFSEKVRKTSQPNDSNRNKPTTGNISLNENIITKLILSVMKTVINKQETKELPEKELLNLIKIELKKNTRSSNGYDSELEK